MADYKRLYPTLSSLHSPPSPSTATTLIVSSDEEEEELDRNVKRHQAMASRLPDHVITSGPQRKIVKKAMCHSTISLSDFENSYFRGRDVPEPQRPSDPYVKFSDPHSLQSLKQMILAVGKWVWPLLYKWRVVIIGALIGVVTILCLDETSGRDNLLPCPSVNKTEPCIEDSDLKVVLPLAKHVRTLLHMRAGRHDCVNDVERNITVHELLYLIFQNHNVKITLNEMKKVFFLILYNQHWHISVYNNNNALITSHRTGLTTTDIMESSRPKKTIICYIRETMLTIWKRLKLLGLVIISSLLLAVIIHYHFKKRRSEMQAVYIMVEEILEMLRAHYRKSQHDKDLLPYIAIIHVRDSLIPPSERQRKQRVWEKAVDWLATQESRVRVETRRIAGEDFTVWRWIQAEPPPTEEPDSQSAQPNAWPGTAFEDYPPGFESKVAPPLGNPSPCIRLKNMFEHVRHVPENQIRDIENAVLERCGSTGSVVHIYVDKRSTYGCVYFKMESLASAQAAYKILHGSWFKGRLITAKYIPESKYYKWFPHAFKAKKSLSPSSSSIKSYV